MGKIIVAGVCKKETSIAVKMSAKCFSPKVHLTLITFLISILGFTQTNTVTIPVSDKQMANYSTSFGGGTSYSGSESVSVLSYSSGFGGTDADVARFLFGHPEFTNDKIKKVVLGLKYKKWPDGTTGAAIANVMMPKHIHNDAVAWSGLSFSGYEPVYNAVIWGDIVFEDGVGTDLTSYITEELIIYDESLPGFPATTLSFFKPTSNSFTLALRQAVGSLRFDNVYVKVTYECDLPATAPASLTAPLIESTQVALNWNDVVDATEYEIRRDAILIGTSPTSDYIATGLTPSTTYVFSVIGKNSCGLGATASDITVTTCSPQPTSLVVTSATTTTVVIDWLGVASTNYKIRLDGLEIATTIASSYTVSGLTPGESYVVSVEANAGDCWSDLTSTSVLTVPSAPTTLVVNPSSSSSLHLIWSPVYGATQYRIYDCVTDLLVNTSVSPSKMISGLIPNTEYSFYVRAYNPSGESVPSGCETGKTKLETPSLFTATALSTSSVECTWTGVPYADSYELYTCGGTFIASTTDEFYMHTGLDQATTYSYKVKAVSVDNESNFPSCKSAITFPEVPSGLTANGVGASEILLSWLSITGPSGFIEIFTDGGTYIGTTTGNNYTVHSLAADTYYSFKIRQSTIEEESDFTPIVGDYTLLPRPDGVISTALTETSLRLNWNEVTGANYYEIYDCDDMYITSVLSGAYMMAEHIITGLSSGTPYTYKIIAYNGYNESLASFCINGYTKLPPVSWLTAAAIYHSKIQLYWSPVAGANSYNIYSCAGTYLGSSLTTDYLVEGLFPMTTYSFKIRAIFIDPDRIDPSITVNGNAASDFSACASATTPMANAPLGGDKNLVSETDVTELRVLPNPFSNYIEIQSPKEIQQLIMYTIDGKIILNQIKGEISTIVNTQELVRGGYIVHILTEDGWTAFKLIK